MRGVTHTLLGAAVALPIAVSRDPMVAAGCIWFGMVGSGLPDWLDLRSDFKTPLRLKHRGASHSLFVLAGSAALLFLVLSMLQRASFTIGSVTIAPEDATIVAWILAMSAGIASHLLADSTTISGISPFLPFSRWRFWLLPRMLRSRSDGYLDSVLRVAAIIALAFGVVVFAARWVPLS
jgi:membrane-bound metal-dependent hydrolase YbcI (DUF457 family)